MAGICLGGNSRESVTEWFHRLQRDVRHPSDRQPGVATTDSFASSDIDTRGRTSRVGCLIVHAAAPPASLRAFCSIDGVREDGKVVVWN